MHRLLAIEGILVNLICQRNECSCLVFGAVSCCWCDRDRMGEVIDELLEWDRFSVDLCVAWMASKGSLTLATVCQTGGTFTSAIFGTRLSPNESLFSEDVNAVENRIGEIVDYVTKELALLTEWRWAMHDAPLDPIRLNNN